MESSPLPPACREREEAYVPNCSEDSLSKPLIITIDGPAGTGKSTVARQLAERLGIGFLDTGAMYRAVAWQAEKGGGEIEESPRLVEIARSLEFHLQGQLLLVNGVEPGLQLRTPAVTRLSSRVAALPEVREVLVEQQRRIASRQSLVTEGRDQGTIVFPQATCKFYLTAAPEIRAMRRYRDFSNKPGAPTFEQILHEQQERDERDRTRAAAPLRAADDAICVDTSSYSREQVVDLLHQHVAKILNSR